MPDIEKKLEKVEEKLAEVEEQIELLKGSIKIDSKEAERHPRMVKLIGDYGEVIPLKTGDYAFVTNIQHKVARLEHKTWDGLMTDISTHRVTDQLRRQIQDDISIILIEGWFTATHAGFFKTQVKEYKHRPYTYIMNWLLSAQMAGTYIYFSPNDYITSKIIISVFNYLNKPEHESMAQRQKLLSMNPELNSKELMLSAIPTVGSDTAKKLYVHFRHSIQEVCNADVNDLQQVEGIAAKKAQIIHDFLRDII